MSTFRFAGRIDYTSTAGLFQKSASANFSKWTLSTKTVENIRQEIRKLSWRSDDDNESLRILLNEATNGRAEHTLPKLGTDDDVLYYQIFEKDVDPKISKVKVPGLQTTLPVVRRDEVCRKLLEICKS